MVRANSLLRERLILPHFNSLWIVRESVKVLAETSQWLDDSSLVKLLNGRGVIRGTDPRRARNIYEAGLYLGLVKRRVLESRKFEYTVTNDGRSLEKCAGPDFPCSEIERNVFLKSLRYFKIPNAAQYQEPSRFKTIYQHKRVRPFLLLLKALDFALRNRYKPNLVTASVAIYANDETSGTISKLVKHVHSTFERPDTSKAPFRDAHTLVSWGRQLGLLHGEGLYEITDEGSKFLKIVGEERPVWWIDSTIQEFVALSTLKEVHEREIGSVSINIASDVPFEHQEKMLSLISDCTTRLSKLPAEIEILRKRVKELEIELARQKEQLSKGVSVDMPQVDELPLLATFDHEVMHKYGGQTTVATEFEKRVCYVFQLLNYDIVELGHKTKEIAPDAILVNKYPSLLKTGPNEAIFIECKASKQPYKFSRHDVREIQDYVERWYGKCLKEYMAVPTALIIVGGQFVAEVVKRSSEVEKRLYNMGLIFVNAEMLVSLIKRFMKDPRSFNHETKAYLFNKLVKEAHRQNAPLANSKEALKN